MRHPALAPLLPARLLAKPLVCAMLASLFVVAGCKEEPRRSGVQAASAETARKSDDPLAEPTPTLKAYPPGVTPPPEPEKPPGAETKTGVCSFRDTGYDGQDTKFAETLVVKLRGGRIVSSRYSYKGSYAQEGTDENLGVPIKENEWASFKVPASSGPVEFKVRIFGNRMKVRGTAVQDAEGNCTWIADDGVPDAGATSK